jgi:hypothetical protein
MKRIHLAILFTTVFSMLFTPAFTNESEPEHAPVKTRPMSDEHRLEVYNIQENPSAEIEAPVKNLPSQQNSTAKSASLAKGSAEACCMDLGYSQYSSPHMETHYAMRVDPYGSLITLEDGSVFSVRGGDQWKVAYWPLNSVVYVLPNHGYFFGLVKSDYDLRLFNSNTGETVEVFLQAGPYLFGNTSEWIADIDPYSGIIWLKDGVAVQVHPDDIPLLWNWDDNDHLIIGTNDDSQQYYYPYILVNVASVNYVRVAFIY